MNLRTATINQKCRHCNGSGRCPSPGWRWWQFWRSVECWPCNGTGWRELTIERPTPPAQSDLTNWVTSEDVEAAKNVIGDCPAEILEMVAILVNLDISTRDHASELAADGFIFRTEEATHRADNYRESINALVAIWGAPEDDDTPA